MTDSPSDATDESPRVPQVHLCTTCGRVMDILRFFSYRLGVHDGLKAFGHRNVRPRQKQYDNIIIRIDYYYVYIILLFRPVAICPIFLL